jgi:hypothetical protein
MNPKINLLVLMLLALVLPATGEEAQADPLQEFELVAVEGLRSLTPVTRGEETWIMHLGPSWFWEEEDLSFVSGDTLIVTGEIVVSEGVTQLYPFKLIHGDREIRLTTEDGIPLWARGFRARGAESSRRQGGHGQGQGNRDGKGHHWGR